MDISKVTKELMLKEPFYGLMLLQLNKLENKNIDIVIQGHTDDLGDAAKNLSLSEERSKSVKNYLISVGIEASRLEAKGFGSTQPKVPNVSDQNRAINRRTDFLISKIR